MKENLQKASILSAKTHDEEKASDARHYEK